MKVLRNIGSSFLLAVKANLGISREIKDCDRYSGGAYHLEGMLHAVVWNILLALLFSVFISLGEIQISEEISTKKLIGFAFFFAIGYPIFFVGFVFQAIREIFRGIGSYLLK